MKRRIILESTNSHCPASTRSCFNVTLKRRFIDVKTMSCDYWGRVEWYAFWRLRRLCYVIGDVSQRSMSRYTPPKKKMTLNCQIGVISSWKLDLFMVLGLPKGIQEQWNQWVHLCNTLLKPTIISFKRGIFYSIIFSIDIVYIIIIIS